MLIPFALLVLSQAAFAAVPPSADSALQRFAPSPSHLSAPANAQALLDLAQESAMADSARILVTALRVTGARSYSEAKLIAIAGFKPQSELTIPELRAMAATISGHYQGNGFLLARAYLPAQDIRDGLVTIAVADDVSDPLIDNGGAASGSEPVALALPIGVAPSAARAEEFTGEHGAGIDRSKPTVTVSRSTDSITPPVPPEIQAPVRPRTPVLPPARFLVFVPPAIVTPVAPPPGPQRLSASPGRQDRD